MTKTKPFVIGVDGGATKTTAVVLDQTGRELGRAQTGSANYHHLGLGAVKLNLLAAMQSAANRAGLNFWQATAVTWALAGVDRPQDREQMQTLAAEFVPDIPVYIENDAVAALVGGLSDCRSGQRPRLTRHGIVLIAGTGTITYGESKQGERARASGWGYLLEQGGAYQLAQEMLRAVSQAEDGLGLPTRLKQRLLQTLNLNQVSDSISWLYHPERQVADVAALAPLLLAEAEAGDLMAIKVAVAAADALAAAVTAVSQRLKLRHGFPLILAGGLLTNSPYYRRLVSQAVGTRLPQAQPVLPRADAAVGAGIIAWDRQGYVDQIDETIDNKPQGWASEQRNQLTQDWDLYPTLTIVGLMHLQDIQAVASLWPTLPSIAQTVEAIANRMRQGGRLFYVGAGTSGRLGILDASECPPTFSTDPNQVIGLIAGGPPAITGSVEAAEDDLKAGAEAIRALKAGPLDTLVGIAASGRTPYVVGALQAAKSCRALTIALTCNLPAPIADVADRVIAPLVGPEALTGSTRLKAGTAQKLVLNMLSTAVMVRLGKTYGNLMVDVQPSNDKLLTRAHRIIMEACGVSDDEAATALQNQQGEVKAAIVSLLAAVSPAEAKARLDQAGGVVRRALELNR